MRLRLALIAAWLAVAPAPAERAAAQPFTPPPGATLPADALGAPPPVEDLAQGILAAREDGEPARALGLLQELQRSYPSRYDAGSYDYLTGLVAAEAGEEVASIKAWRRLIQRGAPLADRAALNLARRLERMEPAAALELVSGFSLRYRDSSLASEARLLELVLRAREGDRLGAERLHRALPRSLRREASRRMLALAVERGWHGEARSRARAMLREKATDDAAYEAARHLLAGTTEELPRAERWALARALFTHREFARAIDELGRIAAEASPGDERAEALLLLGRAAMKAGDDVVATGAFTRLAALPLWRERGSYQLGRVALLCGDLEQAVAAFSRAADLAPRDRIGAEALLKLVRIRSGQRQLDEARNWQQRMIDVFGRNSNFSSLAAIEVAGAALGEGDAEGALADLDAVRPAEGKAEREISYWRGVALAQRGRTAEAADELRRAVSGSDLLSILARNRLAALGAGVAEDVAALLERARRAREMGDPAALAALAQEAIDRGASGEDERAALRLLQSAYRELPAVRAIYELRLLPPGEGGREPVAGRKGNLERTVKLRRLGLDREAAEELRSGGVAAGDLDRLYEVAELARRGGDARTSVAYAERLLRRLPRGFPPACLPPAILRLLYPDAYGQLLEDVAGWRGVDPDLVRSVMREESRFDPGALSPAGARGLMQFIPETARRVGSSIGIEVPEVAAIDEPEVSIPLGAAYLSELLRLFDGNQGAAVAAYNAGEQAAYDWLNRTGTRLLDEFLREIEFAETRSYVDRVLTTLSAYKVRRVLESED